VALTTVPERLAFNHGAAAAWVPPTEATPAAGEPYAQPGRVRDPRPTLAFWGSWAFTALLFFRPQDVLPWLEPLHLPEVVAIIGLTALFAARMSAGLPLIVPLPELFGVLGLAIVMVMTMPFSIWPGGAFNSFVDVYLKVALIFVLLTHSVRSLDMLRRLTWLLVVILSYVALVGAFDYARGVNVQDGRLWGRVAGLMGNPNDYAMNMVTFVPFALVRAFSPGPVARRLLAAAGAVTMLAVVVFTKSRAGMLGAAVMLAVLMWQAGRLRPTLIAAVVAGTLVAAPIMPASVWTRLSGIVKQTEDDQGSREARKLLMREGWHTFLTHPLTGVGVAQFRNYNPPGRVEAWHETHNVLLQVLAELGILGGVCFMFLMAATVIALSQTRRLLRRDWQRRNKGAPAVGPPAFSPAEAEQLRLHLAAALAGFWGWFTCAQFASIGYYWTFYYLLALVVIAREVTRDRLRAAARGWPPTESAA
jgi:putative inorganic carbon (hco3(-)) transporter